MHPQKDDMARRSNGLEERASDGDAHLGARRVVDLEHYAPAYLTWIANKLAHGASKVYRDVFSVGIETWRLLVLLAIERNLTAQAICRVIGMDKASVSRTLKSMLGKGLITVGLDPTDGRYRVVAITRKGRDLHDAILSIALEREKALLSVLDKDEQELFISILRRVHENLPVVEERTATYVATQFPQPRKRRKAAKTLAGDAAPSATPARRGRRDTDPIRPRDV